VGGHTALKVVSVKRNGAVEFCHLRCHAGYNLNRNRTNEGVVIDANSRLLFLAEFLEGGIGAQRIPEWIEPKKGRRDGR
jgi:hypothetical protein